MKPELCSVALGCCIILHSVLVSYGFYPATNSVPRESWTHQRLTEEAVRQMALIYMADYPEQYPDPEKAMTTDEFITALTTFKDSSAVPDTDPSLAMDPRLHFDSEQIVQGNEHLLDGLQTLASGTPGDYVMARELAGELMHSVQDFYSHTNWVEIGHTTINEALGKPGREGELGHVAGPDEETCVDCRNQQNCEDNIVASIISDGILTSGYFLPKTSPPPKPKPDPGDFKPEDQGKCSHGGNDDETRTIPATGGINKDTDASRYSPHYYLHTEAANLAIEGSVELLRTIRLMITEEDFMSFLGLGRGTSLCFSIDTTGSMSNEIDAVKAVTIEITIRSANSSSPPSDYILVPFNDPTFGPVFHTTDPSEMIHALDDLTATGGGDEPELFFNGLILALDTVKPGSQCYAFTDASAKDAHLKPMAESLAIDKEVAVTVIYSTSSVARKRKRRQASAMTTYDYYTEIASVSGGKYVVGAKDEIREVVDIVQVGLSPVQVTILRVDGINGLSVSNATDIPLDSMSTNIFTTVASSATISSITISNPTGAVVSPGPPGSGADVIIHTDASTLKIFEVKSSIRGTWTLQVSTSGVYSIEVVADSLLHFSYQFTELVDSGHSGYSVIEGKPVMGAPMTILVNLYGSDSTSITVHGLRFVSEDGTTLQELPLIERIPQQEYQTTTVLPTNGFRAVLVGEESGGVSVYRSSTNLVQSAVSNVKLGNGSLEAYTIKPGDTVEVQVSVTNYGSPNTYNVFATDTENYIQHVTPTNLTLATNETQTATVVSTAPGNATIGQISTVSVTVVNSMNTDDNFVVFRLTTVTDVVDEAPPVCQVLESFGDCASTMAGEVACEDEDYTVTFQTQDFGSGLSLVRPAEVATDATFYVSSYSRGETNPVIGNYSSPCCYPAVSIVATDLVGLFGVCSLNHTGPVVSETDSDLNIGLIVGLSCAGAALIIGVIMLSVFCTTSKKDTKVEPNPEEKCPPEVDGVDPFVYVVTHK